MSENVDGRMVVITGANGGSARSSCSGTVYETSAGPDSFARRVTFAIGQPDAGNEVLFRPTVQEL